MPRVSSRRTSDDVLYLSTRHNHHRVHIVCNWVDLQAASSFLDKLVIARLSNPKNVYESPHANDPHYAE
jgi:hypothetical protein